MFTVDMFEERAKLAISIGEPAGIGADLLILLSQKCQENILIAFGDPNLLHQRALDLGIKLQIKKISLSDIKQLTVLPAGSIYMIDPLAPPYRQYPAGVLENETAELTVGYLNHAVMACLEGYCDAIVTCPIQKSNINVLMPSFTGHTEYLAELCNSFYQPAYPYQSVMVLMNDELKVALVTTHIPLYKVASSITQSNIINIATIVSNELKVKFKIVNPQILITGLNPHAGDDGILGSEENEIIIPAIQKLVAAGINASGPYAADSLFGQEFTESQVVLAMYHDQGLTGFKARAFNKSANVTLGLPLIRTSVDHGTALDKAGSLDINTNSLSFAIETAARLVNQTRVNNHNG